MRRRRPRLQPPDGGVLRGPPVAALLHHHEDMRRGLSSVVQVVRGSGGARSAGLRCGTPVSILSRANGFASILLPLMRKYLFHVTTVSLTYMNIHSGYAVVKLHNQ